MGGAQKLEELSFKGRAVHRYMYHIGGGRKLSIHIEYMREFDTQKKIEATPLIFGMELRTAAINGILLLLCLLIPLSTMSLVGLFIGTLLFVVLSIVIRVIGLGAMDMDSLSDDSLPQKIFLD